MPAGAQASAPPPSSAERQKMRANAAGRMTMAALEVADCDGKRGGAKEFRGRVAHLNAHKAEQGIEAELVRGAAGSAGVERGSADRAREILAEVDKREIGADA